MKHSCFFKRALVLVLCAVLLCSAVPTAFGASAPVRLGTPVYGIDVSRWQGTIDFAAIKASGIDFVIIRVGAYGKDANFDANYAGAKAAGLGVGAYLYSYAETEAEAVQDAQDVCSWIADKSFEYPIYFDIEDQLQAALTTSLRTAMCHAFIAEMARNGYYAGVYANLNWFTNYLDLDALSEYPLWLARWITGEPSTPPDPVYGMWQYTDQGNISGISGNVDRDICYMDYPAYVKENGLNGFKKPNPYDPDLPFVDVRTDDWFYAGVKYAYDHGLINGMTPTQFAPEVQVTRAMFVTMLGRMHGVKPEDTAPSGFVDVDMNEWYGSFVAWAAEHKIVDGVGDERFAPDDPITREQMCTMIGRYVREFQYTLTGTAESFADEDTIAAWAIEYVNELAGAGIIDGMEEHRFRPLDHATRAQCVTLLMRLHKALG